MDATTKSTKTSWQHVCGVKEDGLGGDPLYPFRSEGEESERNVFPHLRW
jgi:hypothetical protein